MPSLRSCPRYAHALVTLMPSLHSCPRYDHALVTLMPSSHSCPRYDHALVTLMPSSHSCPRYAHALVTLMPLLRSYTRYAHALVTSAHAHLAHAYTYVCSCSRYDHAHVTAAHAHYLLYVCNCSCYAHTHAQVYTCLLVCMLPSLWNILSILEAHRHQWLGHVHRMSEDRLPRWLLTAWVQHTRPKGRPHTLTFTLLSHMVTGWIMISKKHSLKLLWGSSALHPVAWSAKVKAICTFKPARVVPPEILYLYFLWYCM